MVQWWLYGKMQSEHYINTLKIKKEEPSVGQSRAKASVKGLGTWLSLNPLLPQYGFVASRARQCPTVFKLSPPWGLIKKWRCGTSLVGQWLRIRLPTQGIWVRALVWEDPTCRGATKPMCRNYWACALGPASHNYWAPVPQLLKPTCLEPMLRNKRSHRHEKPAHRNEE